jgi:hypothetical protein
MPRNPSKLHPITATAVLTCALACAWLSAGNADAAPAAVTLYKGKLLIQGADADDRIGLRQSDSRPAVREADLDGDGVAGPDEADRVLLWISPRWTPRGSLRGSSGSSWE